MLKTYKMAYKDVNPRFATLQKKDKHNRVPYSLDKSKWQDEKKIIPVSAWSNSIFSVKLYWWKKSFNAENVSK